MQVAIVVGECGLDWGVEALLSQLGCDCNLIKFDAVVGKASQRLNFDLFVVSSCISDGQALRITKAIRLAIGDAPPLLILSERSEKQDFLAALDAGADDLFNLDWQSTDLFIAKVKSIIRRAQTNPGSCFETFGPYLFDLTTYSVKFGGKIEKLTPKEFGLAIFMFRNMNNLVSRDAICENVWGRRINVQTRTIDIHISKIRAKLKLEENKYIINSMYGRGYMLRELIGER